MKKSFSNHDSGFALIVAISLMAFIILMLLSLSALVSLELASTTTDRDRIRAEENALLGLNVALGNIQRLLGKDQRVSASPLLLDRNISAGDPRENWTGVWDSAEFLSDGITPNPNFGQHLGWLISGFDDAGFAGGVPAFSSSFNGDGELSDVSNAKLIGGGTVDHGAGSNLVDYIAAPRIEIDGTSSYAYWVSDEGRKAQVNLASRDDLGETYTGTTDNIKSRFYLSSPARFNASALSGLEDLQLEGDEGLARAVFRSNSSRDLILGEPGDVIDSKWSDALPSFHHDLNYGSITLQTDVRNGGLKRDLSLLFELDDADFARTPYSGEATDSVFDNWAGSELPLTDGSDYVDPATGDQVSYLFKEPVPEYVGKDAYLRGPTWHYLRDFYRLYKDVDGNSTRPVINTRPFAPNAGDFASKGGERGYIWTMESDNGGDIQNKDSYVNTVVQTKHDPNEKVTRLTGHEIMPMLNRIVFIFSLYEDRSVDEWVLRAPGETTSDGSVAKEYMFDTTGGITNAIALVVDPIVYLWNPYNVAIEFDGGFKVHSTSFPFMISIAPPGTDILPPISDPTIPQMTGHIATFGRMNSSNFGKLDIVVGGSGDIIRMEPGEVKVFSSAEKAPIPLADLPKVNTENSSVSSPMFRVIEGFNQDGGVLLGRRENTKESFPDEGVLHQLKTSSSQSLEVNVFPWGSGFFSDNNNDGINDKDFRSRTSVGSVNEFAYVPSNVLSQGGSLVETDTYLQRLFLQLYGPSNATGAREPVMDLLYGDSGTGGDFPLVVKPSEIDNQPNRKWPFLFYGTYQNPVEPDLDRVESPAEFVGTMSPFAPNVDAQFSNFRVSNPPFSVQLGHADSYDEIQELDGRGFFGTGYSASGETHLVISEIPTYPLRSLASLQHARISPSSYMPGQAIGNSWATGFVGRDQKYDRDGRYTQYDISYLSNEALFDSYFFSSLTPTMDLTGDVREAMDLKATLSALVQAVSSEGRMPELSNERFEYVGGTDALDISSGVSTFTDNLSGVDGFSKTASYFGVRGGFNINSLSVNAWDAFLASTLGTDYDYLDPVSGFSTKANSDLTILPRSTLPNADSSNEWLGPKGLTGIQRRQLAEAIVAQVELRGPFLSLSDFVNRELAIADEGKVGPIQAAIDSLDINDGQQYENAYIKGVSNDFHVDNVTAKTGVGTPQYLAQADVLTPLAPYLSARSDTFVVRSYGDVEDPFTNEIKSRAWCEAVVQRIPKFVDESEAPDTQLPNLTQFDNQNLGRQFRVISFRWLNEDEV
ncbi:hypothetical protein [Rubellicoccus peritrichatus]|uniref:Uncharacterized protein n=1 Tax=Rubellicoccus peritrichatus TaxID=3080537 RepID=A0AAQ3QXY2_9BACT|nr:hypothetical protein [Puniceicoccus sp. CR14]WOO43275.1 hypothetical protein RZN69_09250 [Puniceicoccus sp. CR14]